VQDDPKIDFRMGPQLNFARQEVTGDFQLLPIAFGVDNGCFRK